MQVEPNLGYLTVGSWQGKLDIYRSRSSSVPAPTLVYFHGGGWTSGSKEEVAPELATYLAMGFVVVSAGYRLASVASAPAAIEDCRCALRWVTRHAQHHGFDAERLVLAGHSAGGHLALMTGMAPTSAGFDKQCPERVGEGELRVAAIVNYFGIVDVSDVIAGPHQRDWALQWLGSSPDPDALARRVSPITYVTKGVPPVLTIHGDADQSVPYDHARRLHAALDGVGVRHQLVTVRGGQHGDFSTADTATIAHSVREFLSELQIVSRYRPAP